VKIVDLAEVALPMLDEPQHPETSAYERTSRNHRSGVRLHPGAARVQLWVYRAGEERPRLRCSRCAACVPRVGLGSPFSCLVRTDRGHRPETNEARRDHGAITGRTIEPERIVAPTVILRSWSAEDTQGAFEI
jgi:hypothetical protein